MISFTLKDVSSKRLSCLSKEASWGSLRWKENGQYLLSVYESDPNFHTADIKTQCASQQVNTVTIELINT